MICEQSIFKFFLSFKSFFSLKVTFIFKSLKIVLLKQAWVSSGSGGRVLGTPLLSPWPLSHPITASLPAGAGGELRLWQCPGSALSIYSVKFIAALGSADRGIPEPSAA